MGKTDVMNGDMKLLLLSWLFLLHLLSSLEVKRVELIHGMTASISYRKGPKQCLSFLRSTARPNLPLYRCDNVHHPSSSSSRSQPHHILPSFLPPPLRPSCKARPHFARRRDVASMQPNAGGFQDRRPTLQKAD